MPTIIAQWAGQDVSSPKRKIWAAAVVQEDDGTAKLLTAYGPEYNCGAVAAKSFANRRLAEAEFGKTVRSKQPPNKHYAQIAWNKDASIVSSFNAGHIAFRSPAATGQASVASTPTTPRPVPVASPPMQHTERVSHVMPLTEAEMLQRLQDDTWGVTEKVDDERCAIVGDVQQSTPLRAFNRKGVERGVPKAALALHALFKFASTFIIDGGSINAVDGGYVLFDLLEWDGVNIRVRPFSERIAILENALTRADLLDYGGPLLADSQGPIDGLALLFPVATTDEKQAVFDAIKNNPRGEGVIFRKMDGVSHAGDTKVERKWKFRSQLDVAIVGFEPGLTHGAFTMALRRHTDNEWVNVGSVYNGLKQDDADKLNVALSMGYRPVLTVESLRARMVTVKLVEPTVPNFKVRTDKNADECSTQQLIDVFGAPYADVIAKAPVLNLP